MRLVIAISGPIAVGKSEFIVELLKRLNGVRISTRELIRSLRTVSNERGLLQQAGDSLDVETDGKWVADALSVFAAELSDDVVAIVDSVRITKQIEHLRIAYPDKVKHIHLTASQEVLVTRFVKRKQSNVQAVLESATYDQAKTNATEADIEKLAATADLCIVTDVVTAEAAATHAVNTLGIS